MAAIITKMNRLNGCTVAIDGSVFVNYPHYANRMKDALRELVGLTAENIVLAQGNNNFEIYFVARDGSGQGAALIACLMGNES